MLTVALSKGRILDETVDLFERCGINCENIRNDNRKLIITNPEEGMKFILAKPFDVPTYVEHGVADLGVVGKDILLEQEKDVYELLDLGLGYCRLVVAGPRGKKGYPRHLKIATKFPRAAEKYYLEKGVEVEVIKLHGSVELAPLLGLSDKIVDIVSTGNTLRQNNLIELETISEITARLIANRVSFRLKGESINKLVEILEKNLEGNKKDDKNN